MTEVEALVSTWTARAVRARYQTSGDPFFEGLADDAKARLAAAMMTMTAELVHAIDQDALTAKMAGYRGKKGARA